MNGVGAVGALSLTVLNNVQAGAATALLEGDEELDPGEPPELKAARPDGPAAGSNGVIAERKPSAPAVVTEPAEPEFPISERGEEFRRRFFPESTRAQWNDWKWQLRSRVKDVATLSRIFRLSDDERNAVEHIGGQLPVGVTPYYASIMSLDDPSEPVRRTMIPVGTEFTRTRGEADDPLGEDTTSPVEGLVHRYPDRVLFLVTNFCATYCRYCTRARMVGKTGEYHFTPKQFQKAIDYIAAHPEIRDCLLSGGDPLTLGDDRLDWLLTRLRAIPHLEFLRIGSKVPAVLPMRITRKFCEQLKKLHPLWMSIHFMHPAEVTEEVREACGRLADHGVPLGSQTVLTRGVNDSVEVMKQLVHRLLMARVRPYYLYQCDPISGSSHFRTPVEKGLEIIRGLRGHTTGYAVPTFVVDGPGGGGKMPLMPEYVVGRDGDDVLLKNFEGKVFRYPDPGGSVGRS
ncbi:MAG: KamA family radical SAM protein [Phycisphaerales bacterium]|nr:KamA family radical SAM protein [Phycisphaerales bacterium]